MRFSTLLLDADNTIFDFDTCEYEAFRQTLIACGLPFDDDVYEVFRSINASLWKELEIEKITVEELRLQRFTLMLNRCFASVAPSRLGKEMAGTYVEMLSQQAFLYEHSLEDIQLLSQYYTLCVITNGIKGVQRNRFALSPVTPYIRKLYISEEIGAQKPKKEFFQAVLNDLQEKDIDRVLVVGDSLTSDMQGGRNAGVTTCLFDPARKVSMPHPLCDYQISRLREILLLDGGGADEISCSG